MPEHVEVNRAHWNATALDWVLRGEESWAMTEPEWGVWGLPESQLQMLPVDMTGMQAIELGCGTGYVSGWMARRGARVLGIDISERQLETARRLALQHGARIELIHGNAESVPRPDGSFDFAISEYGAAIWCDPHVWIREAWRLLRPGGRLVFLGNHPLAAVCSPLDGSPTGERLARPWFGLHRIDWRYVEIDPGGIEFTLPISDWMRLFREVGFEVEDLLELQAPEGAEGVQFSVPAAWARRWPCETVWKVRKR
jgi:SAM-dependent methyltransferase